MDAVLPTDHRLSRAFLEASQAGVALFWINIVGEKILAEKSGAPFLFDVCLILLSEVADRTEDGVGRALS